MRILKFTGLLIWKLILQPVGAVLCLPLLAIAWCVLGTIVFLMQTWGEAK